MDVRARLDELPIDLRRSTIDGGSAVQDRPVTLSGEEIVGWKLGVGSTACKCFRPAVIPAKAGTQSG